MLRLLVALPLMGVGLMRIARYIWIIKTQTLAHETTLLGGRWNAGKRGVLVYLALSVVQGVLFVLTGLAMLVGWFNVVFPVLVGTACLSMLLTIVAWPLGFWVYIIMLFPFAVALGVAWLVMHFTS